MPGSSARRNSWKVRPCGRFLLKLPGAGDHLLRRAGFAQQLEQHLDGPLGCGGREYYNRISSRTEGVCR